ncbi:hypothetical protein SIL04_10055 [Bacillus cereus group sp. BfR-BA-00331]|uniref:hypothetical protein n=1 Tax=Bacillus cereus group TaxID=86661 RepID=UPI00077269B1|nr:MULTISPECIES: hypothetical protein [Bacillus cereus group]ONG70135.1 hypothetical protein BKK44_14035 [Bacillus cereus]MDA2192078.1 hypothetical protein [Bacillus cereus group sp. Bc238]MDA2197581.1 hypothetical protein [Bacillus cereus group sp. Bc237]MDA2756295.1 hypothetical protein [Bacillus cereus group sp. Bc007]MDA2761740.1 hypothetical protein [Bacillus cereus group sp. Bc008]
MMTLNGKSMKDSLHGVKTSEGFSFIVSTHELRNLSPWIKPSEHSSDDLLFYRKLILADRKSLKRQLKRGYKPIKVLDESDRFVWFIIEELFNSPVTLALEDRTLKFEISDEDRDILKGNMTNILARQLL